MGLAAAKVLGCLAVAGAVTLPQAVSAQSKVPGRAVGAEIFYSSDSDDTEVLRTAADFDLRNHGPDRRLGLRLEQAQYDPQGTGRQKRERVFLQAADVTSGWSWNARVGTDGDTIIGSASLHDDAKYRKELFVERDIVETRQGLAQGIYSTFVGAAIDLPADDRHVFTVLAGVQEFTGENVRLHVRGNYVHVVNPELGLSAQLRGRYFHNSDPREFDYYSPRWYAQVLPVLQMRRFVDGWEFVGAGGVGVQRDSESKWRRSDFAQLRVRTPAASSNWSGFGELTYSSSPSNTSTAGAGYRYFQSMIGITRRF